MRGRPVPEHDRTPNVVFNCGTRRPRTRASDMAGYGSTERQRPHGVCEHAVLGQLLESPPGCVSLLKPFRKKFPETQNTRTLVFNGPPAATTASVLVQEPLCERPPRGQDHGLQGQESALRDAALRFRPTPSHPGGRRAVVPPYTNGYVGKAPDIGAYESGGTWTAGRVGLGPECDPARGPACAVSAVSGGRGGGRKGLGVCVPEAGGAAAPPPRPKCDA